MKLKYEMVITEIGDEVIAVPVGDASDSFRGVVKINETAASILKLLEQDTTEEKIVEAMLKEYEVDPKTLANSVSHFIKNLRQEGLLVE